jgi:hypothetical protein
MKTPHKHARIIKAWANGAEIQSRENSTDSWETATSPSWVLYREYRIKPEPQVIEGFIDIDYARIVYTEKTLSNRYKRCTITIHPDE